MSVWDPAFCRPLINYGKSKTSACFRNRTVVFLGDSRARQQTNEISGLLQDQFDAKW